MDTDKLKEESTPADIPGLVAQARAAYQQNRIRECLALTKAVLLVDPGNTAAIEMQSTVRFDMQRDLSDARALIEESRNKPEAPKYRKAAEIILLKTLYLDPDSEGAKTLLSSIRSVSEGQSATAPALAPIAQTAPVTPIAPPPLPVAPPVAVAPPVPVAPVILEAPPADQAAPIEYEEEPVFAPAAARIESPMPEYVTQPEIPGPDPIPFTTGTTFVERPGKKKNSLSGLTVPIVIVAIAVLGGGLLLARQHMGSVQTASAASATAASENTGSPASARPVSYPLAPVANSAASSTSNSASAPQTKPALTALNSPPPLPAAGLGNSVPAANSRTSPVAAAAMGSLAVSSPIAAEIYMGDKYLGATPTTLQLPAGNQTLEYRHGDLRSVLTHVVKANETTTALVTFDVVVVLQAKPWANVFIEGSARLPLGQTPLSDVKLPIGSVLVFENPNFPSKSHKIAADDKTIQMVFQ